MGNYWSILMRYLSFLLLLILCSTPSHLLAEERSPERDPRLEEKIELAFTVIRAFCKDRSDVPFCDDVLRLLPEVAVIVEYLPAGGYPFGDRIATIRNGPPPTILLNLAYLAELLSMDPALFAAIVFHELIHLAHGDLPILPLEEWFDSEWLAYYWQLQFLEWFFWDKDARPFFPEFDPDWNAIGDVAHLIRLILIEISLADWATDLGAIVEELAQLLEGLRMLLFEEARDRKPPLNPELTDAFFRDPLAFV